MHTCKIGEVFLQILNHERFDHAVFDGSLYRNLSKLLNKEKAVIRDLKFSLVFILAFF